MKKIIVVVFLLICFLVWKNYYEVKFHMDWERTGFMIVKGGYRAWWIRYSEGLQYQNGKWKPVWCLPRYEHCDVRPFLKSLDDK